MLERKHYYSEYWGPRNKENTEEMKVKKRWKEGLEDKLLFRVLSSTWNRYFYSVCGGQVTRSDDILKPQGPRFPPEPSQEPTTGDKQQRQAPVSHRSLIRLWTSVEEGETISLWGEPPPSWQSVIDVETRWPHIRTPGRLTILFTPHLALSGISHFPLRSNWMQNLSSITTKSFYKELD